MFAGGLKKNWLSFLLLTMGVLLLPFVWQLTARNQSGSSFSEEKINLALRRTAHLMLAAAGDSKSPIGPVVKTDICTWQIRMDHSLNYDILPKILQESFDQHLIGDSYNVAILNCADGELQLGYNYQDYVENKDVPCGGRDMAAGCYQLQVNFPELEPVNNRFPDWAWVSALLLVGAGFYLLGKNKKRDRPAPLAATTATTKWIHFGNSKMDLANLLLVCGTVQHQLTYREAKLLHFFATQPNQLLDRNVILQHVWAEEGIMVSRSVDVFVSRLRKMLRDDPTLNISAVHGVGYKLSIT